MSPTTNQHIAFEVRDWEWYVIQNGEDVLPFVDVVAGTSGPFIPIAFRSPSPGHEVGAAAPANEFCTWDGDFAIPKM